jgi:hypothetical protein
VAVGSFCVHLAIVSNTTWVRDFLNGSGGKHVAMAPASEAAVAAAPGAKK